MARTFKDRPYHVVREELGREEKFLRPARQAERVHALDAIFYAHELEAIARFEAQLQADERLDAFVEEVTGHLLTGSGEDQTPWRSLRFINGQPVEELLDRRRKSIGFHKPGLEHGVLELARKSNLFKVFHVYRVSERREALMELEKFVPYWAFGWSSCHCSWCEEPRGKFKKREARELHRLRREFNGGVALEELDDELL